MGHYTQCCRMRRGPGFSELTSRRLWRALLMGFGNFRGFLARVEGSNKPGVLSGLKACRPGRARRPFVSGNIWRIASFDTDGKGADYGISVIETVIRGWPVKGRASTRHCNIFKLRSSMGFPFVVNYPFGSSTIRS